MTAEREERILDQLRSTGGRITSARRALVRALLTATEHVTAEDLAAQVQQEQPDVAQSTIYRTLDALEQLGVVDHTHLGHGRAVYHLTDERHQHLVCEECGAVTEAPLALFDDLARTLKRRYRFTLRPEHFAVLGRCAACS